MHCLKKKFVIALASAALLVPIAGASTASANHQNGLVNVYVTDIANGNQITLLQNVSVPIAAAFCNVNANVLSVQLQNNQFGNCPAKSSSRQTAWVSYN